MMDQRLRRILDRVDRRCRLVRSCQWLTALWVASNREAWAAGKSGTLLRFDGSGWKPVDTGTRNHLYAVTGDANVVRVAGMNATILALPRSR